MGRPIILPEFGSSATGHAAIQTPVAFTESERLAAYEQGYAAGWDDAARNAADEHGRISAGLAAQLQDLSFTFHEARGHVLRAIEPILRDALQKVLPGAARDALPRLLVEQVEPMLAQAAEAPILIMVSPGDHERIAAVMPVDPAFPVALHVDPTLAEGQVHMRTGQVESEIDLDRVVAEIATALEDFYTLSFPEEKQVANG